MKRFSQTVKVVLALFVAVFANGTLTSITAYAAEPGDISTTTTQTAPSIEPVVTEDTDTAPQAETQPIVQPLDEQAVLKSAIAPPTIEPCTSTTSELVNTKAGFASYDDQRANGHYQFKSNGVRIYTDSDSDSGPRTDGGSGNWNTDKVAWYRAVDYPLTQVGLPSMNYTATFGLQPGLQLVIDFNNDSTPDGILVGETVYGNNWWLSNSATPFVKDGAPNNGGGNGSQWYGTLNEWLASFPQAKVKAIGFSLGSGVHADGILNSLTFGCHTWNFGLKQVQTSTPKVTTDTCGTKNDTYTIPESEGVIYSVNGDTVTAGTHTSNGKAVVIVKATPAEGYTLKGKTSWTLVFNVIPCIPVTPRTPDFYDYCGASKSDSVEIPFTVGVIYKIDGKTARPGSYPVSSASVTVTAEASEGFVIREGATSTWTYEFTNSDCIAISKSSEPVTDTNGDGMIGIGDTVTWTITVTNNSPNKYENFRVQVEDKTAKLENDGLIKSLEPGKSVTLTATSVLTENDVKVCKATNSAQFTAWYTKKHQHLDNDGIEGNRFLPSRDEDSNSYDLSGSTEIVEATFTCPTPGSGDGGSTTTTTSEELPTVLPSTGPTSTGSPIVILAAAAIAYGATYFLQRRRETSVN